MIDGMNVSTKKSNASFLTHLLSNFFFKSLYFYSNRKNMSELWILFFKIYSFFKIISSELECHLLYLYST